MFNALFYICDNIGFLRAMSLIKTVVTIIQFLVPIGLIVWITVDLFKNMVNPENKDGIKKIGTRLGAAVIVFVAPAIVTGILNIFDYVTGDTDYKVSNCYTNANSSCVENINTYLNCEDSEYSEEEKEVCLELRSCNSYKLDSSCTVTTDVNDSMCSQVNNKDGSYKYIK